MCLLQGLADGRDLLGVQQALLDRAKPARCQQIVIWFSPCAGGRRPLEGHPPDAGEAAAQCVGGAGALVGLQWLGASWRVQMQRD